MHSPLNSTQQNLDRLLQPFRLCLTLTQNKLEIVPDSLHNSKIAKNLSFSKESQNVTSDFDILKGIYNAFNPAPLPAGSDLYVDCQAVWGGSNVLVALGDTIRFSDEPTCQLYTGHRGGGKSTELLRLKQNLEWKGCTVVYFSAEDTDINPEDVEYTDILIACTRHLLETIREADSKPILSWFKERLQALEDLMLTEININNPEATFSISDMAKITTSFKTQPTQRAQLRKVLNPYTDKLVDALNQFIADAQQKLPSDRQRLVLIADGLEKVTLVPREEGRTNHDEIFIDHSEQLKGLNCDLIYTVPISLVLSSRGPDLMEIYNCTPHVLPMIMTRNRQDSDHDQGLAILYNIIQSRVNSVQAEPEMVLESEVFDGPAILKQLCLMSGGHVRNLMLLVQTAIKYNEEEALPIRATGLEQAVRQLRKIYRDAVSADQWDLLAAVHETKQIINDEAHRRLLFNRCLLEYREEESWHSVHPVLRDVSEFKTALDKRKKPANESADHESSANS